MLVNPQNNVKAGLSVELAHVSEALNYRLMNAQGLRKNLSGWTKHILPPVPFNRSVGMVLRCASTLKKANPIPHLQPIPLCCGRVVPAGGIAWPSPIVLNTGANINPFHSHDALIASHGRQDVGKRSFMGTSYVVSEEICLESSLSVHSPGPKAD